MDLDLDAYNSEEDEDYIDEGGLSDDFDGADEFGGPSIGGVIGRKKRKKAGLGGGALPGKDWKMKKKSKKGVGADVISDDDDEIMMKPQQPPQPPPSKPAVQSTPTPPASIPSNSESASASTPAESTSSPSAPLSSAAQPSAAAPTGADTAASTATSPALPSPPPSSAASPSPSPSASPSSSLDFLLRPSTSVPNTPPVPSNPSVPSTGGQSLSQLLASFQKPKTVLPTSSSKPPLSSTSSIPLPWEKKSTVALPFSTPSAAQAQAQASAALEKFLSKTTPTPSTAPSASVALSSTNANSTTDSTTTLSDDKIVVKEITSYAGETMEITKTILKGSIEDKLRQKASKDNLATLVASLTAKKSMSTLAKSAVDWQISKDEEGDSAELEKAAKNGYVDKLAFLAKTDMRQFELEKEARNQARRLAEKKAAGGPIPSAGSGDGSFNQEEDDNGEEE